MSQLISFIEKGKSIYGSYGSLANKVGVPQSLISMWKSGAKPCTAPYRAALAVAVGEDPAQAALEAALEGINLEKPQGKRTAHALQLALHRYKTTAPRCGVSAKARAPTRPDIAVMLKRP